MQLLDARLMAERIVAIGGAGRRLRRILAVKPVHLIKVLRLGVVGFKIFVPDRPSRRETTVMLDLAEILLAEPQQHCPVDFGVPADVVVDAGMENLPVLVLPALLGLVLVVDEDGAGIPVLLLARQIVSPLEQQN